jgi:hypothetical protein
MEDARGHGPGARIRPGVCIGGVVGDQQQIGPEAQEGDDPGENLVDNGPAAPVRQRRFQRDVLEASTHGVGHREVDPATRG